MPAEEGNYQKAPPAKTVRLLITALSLALIQLVSAEAPATAKIAAEEEAEAENGVIVEVELESTWEYERNLDLIDVEDSNVMIQETEFVVGIEYEPSDKFAAEIVFVLGQEEVLHDPLGEEEHFTKLEIEEALLTFNDILFDGLFFEVGRLQFRDDRMWLYDKKLDAVKIGYEPSDRFELELAASREFAVDADLLNHQQTDDIRNYSAVAEYTVSDALAVGGYYVKREHVADGAFRPIHLGMRLHGEVERANYWLNAGRVRGKEEGERIRGFGFDLGGTYRFDAPWNPSITLGYARGSGDPDPDDGRDEAFRQTGLQKNESRLGGLARFKHFGQVFDPELSNMHIITAGVGLRDHGRSSLDLVYHRYRALEIADEVRDAGVDGEFDEDFAHKELGDEFDLVFTRLGLGSLTNLGLELKVGYFRPGRAFSAETRDTAAFVSFGIAYAFGKDPDDLFKR